MADFMTSYMAVQANEGWSGKPSPDNNGATVRYGINARAFPDMPAGFYDGSMDDATALSAAQAHYRSVEWAGIMGGLIQDQVLANHLLDHAVNAGLPGAVKLLQCVLNNNGDKLGLDGTMGPETLAAANASATADMYRTGRAGYYAAVSFTAAGGGRWLPTWLARLKACG